MATRTATLNNNPYTLKPPTTTRESPSASSSTPPERIRPYKDFLTPALHRRFSHAAALVFAACYIESLLMGPPSLFWIWNPISLTGLRAVMLFMPCLAVFIIRVANIHCGELVAASSAGAIASNMLGWKGLHTLGWYLFSACFFAEIYIWSTSKSDRLGWVNAGGDDEWSFLNENPIYLRGLFILLAMVQTVKHLNNDYDRVPIPTKETAVSTLLQQQQSTSPIPRSIIELRTKLPSILGRTAKLSVPVLACSAPVYFLLLRPLLWPMFYAVGRTLFPSMAAQTKGDGVHHVARLLWQCFSSSFLLILLWEMSSDAFTTYVARPPLGRAEDGPLTGIVADGKQNKDPNESLITGLKSKKETPRAFAFWELSIICATFGIRRKTIYTEVDRTAGSTWAQISKLCIDEISAVRTRIEASQLPPQPSSVSTPSQQSSTQQTEDYSLPKMADRGVQNGDVWVKQRPDVVQSVGNIVRSVGQNPGATSPLVPGARKAIEWGADRVLSKDEQARLTPEGLSKQASGWITKFLSTPVGEPFRRTFADRVRAIVFGAPYSSKATIMHASRALSKLCSFSLKEDDYGQVSKSIALVIRTYVETIRAIQGCVQITKPDWSDVYFTQKDRNIADVEELVDVLRQGLEEVVLAFGEYASSISVTKKELREARELIGKTQEMTTR